MFEKLELEDCLLTQGQKRVLYGSGIECSTTHWTNCGGHTENDGWDIIL